MTAAGLSARCAPLGKYRMPRACPAPPGFRNCSRRTRLPDRRLRISGRDAIRAGSGTSSAGGRPATGRSAAGPDCRPQGTDWSDTRIPGGVPARYRGRSGGGGMLPYCPCGCCRPFRNLCRNRLLRSFRPPERPEFPSHPASPGSRGFRPPPLRLWQNRTERACSPQEVRSVLSVLCNP